jgi:hypothetical protein
MKLNILDTISKRIAFSIGLSLIVCAFAYVFFGDNLFHLYGILIISVMIFIPVTLFYAIVSTFFTATKKSKSEDILDD